MAPRSPAPIQGVAASRGYSPGGGQVWLWQDTQPSQEPGNRKARMRHWTQDPIDPEGARRVTGQKGQCLPLPRPSPGWLPASACSPHDPQKPTQTWLGKLTCGEQPLQPQERQRDVGRGSDGNSEHLPGPTVPRNSRVSDRTGQSGERKAGSGGAAQGACACPPLLARPPQGKAGNWPHFGHFPQLGSFSLNALSLPQAHTRSPPQ